MPTLRRWARRLVPVVFYSLLAVFLVVYLRKVDFSTLEDITPAWWFLVLATLLGMLARYLGAYTWVAIIRTLGAPQLRLNRQLVAVYAKAWLGRYIPGTAPWILSKIYFASQHGIAKQKLAVASLLEGGIQVVTLLVFSLGLLAFDSRLDAMGDNFKHFKLLMIIVAVCGIVALVPPVFNWLLGGAFRVLRRKSIDSEHLATPTTVTLGSALYLVDAAIAGLSLFFIAKCIDPSLSYHNILFAMGAASLASAASMLAIFAPSGLGVREAIQLVLFSLIMPKELAAAVTVAMRLWNVGLDVIFFGVSKLIAGKAGEALSAKLAAQAQSKS